MRTLPLSTLALALTAIPAVAQQARFQDTALLDMAVAQFTGRVIGEEGGARTPVDVRLKLATCPLPQLEWHSPAQDAVAIRCMAPVWRMFVPVNRSAPVAVAPADTAATAKPEKIEPVIKRGDAIVVEAGSPGFSITRDGVAMSDAAPGARVLVKVEDKKPPIQAIAIEPGRAMLPGWSQ